MGFVSYFPGRGTVREMAYLEGKAEGEARGLAKGVLLVLDVRAIPVPDTALERIITCTDPDLATTWLQRSRTVGRAEELFADS